MVVDYKVHKLGKKPLASYFGRSLCAGIYCVLRKIIFTSIGGSKQGRMYRSDFPNVRRVDVSNFSNSIRSHFHKLKRL